MQNPPPASGSPEEASVTTPGRPGGLSPNPDHGISAVMQGASIGRGTAWAMTVLFAVLIVIPPVHQYLVEMKGEQGWRFLRLFHETPTSQSLKSFENELARESDLAKQARIAYQNALTAVISQGSEKVLVGRDGFLFFRKEVDLAFGPGILSDQYRKQRNAAKNHTDVAATIIDFDRQLKERNVHLVFLVAPVKPVIYPENLWPGYPQAAGPAWNHDYAAFRAKLLEAGVDAIDVADDLWKGKSGAPMFLKLDTHWTPAGLAVVANRVADHVKPLLAGTKAEKFTERTLDITNTGDLFTMLELSSDQSRFPAETVTITQTVSGDALAAIDAPEPTVILLGDSYSNIYNSVDLHWGEGAGLPHQLLRRLGVPLHAIAQNGKGASDVRLALARKASLLNSAKVVIWEVSARDLYDEQVAWNLIPLPQEGVTSAATTTSKETIIAELLTDAPEIKKGPYRNVVMTLKFRVVDGSADQTMLISTIAMREAKLLPIAHAKRGQKWRMSLRPERPKETADWFPVSPDELSMELDEPAWAEDLAEAK